MSASTTATLVLWINRGLELLWLLIVVSIPLAFVSRGYMLSEGDGLAALPKIALFRTLVGLMAILWLTEWGLRGRLPLSSLPRGGGCSWREPLVWLAGWRGWLSAQPTRWVVLAVWFYLGSVLISTLLSPSRSVSLWGETPGTNNYATYTVVSYFLFFGVIVSHLKSRSQLWRLLGAIVATGVLVAGYGVLQHYGRDFFDLKYGGVSSTVGNPIFAAAVLLMSITVSLVVATNHLHQPLKDRRFWVRLAFWSLALAVQFLGIIFISSRGPWIGTIAALVGFFALVGVFAGWRPLARAMLVGVLAAILTWAIVSWPSSQGGNSAAVSAEPLTLPPAAASPVGSVVTERFAATAVVTERFAAIGSEVTAKGLSGRLIIWNGSWQLWRHHPWFGFDDLSLVTLRPFIGYGPELFRYAYLLGSPFSDPIYGYLPSHAHNYFIHQGVELGLLGLLTSLGPFAALFLVGGYQLLWERRSYSPAHRLLVVGLLAVMAGRMLEQMVGVARVADLTVFWALLAVFVALPTTMQTPAPSPTPATLVPRRQRSRGRRSSSRSSNDWQLFWRLAVVAGLVIGIGTLTWVKAINYPRAAVIAAVGANQLHSGDLRGALSSFDRAIDLAPDVTNYHYFQSRVYDAYRENRLGSKELKCSVQVDTKSYEICLAQEAYKINRLGVESRPFDYWTRLALADSALALAALNEDPRLRSEASQLVGEVGQMWPHHWRLRNRVVEIYLQAGEPGAAARHLEESLAITGNTGDWPDTLILRGEAYRRMGQYRPAIEDFDEAIGLSPGNATAYNGRAMAYANLKQYQRAIEDYDEAVRLNPQFTNAYVNRGAAYADLGQPEQTVRDASEAIGQDPREANAYGLRAMAYAILGKDAEALQDIERAVELGYDSAVLQRTIERLKQQP